METTQEAPSLASIPIARVYITKTTTNANKPLKLYMLLVLCMAGFLIIASHNMVGLSKTARKFTFLAKSLKDFQSITEKGIHGAFLDLPPANQTHEIALPITHNNITKEQKLQPTCSPRHNLAFIKTHKTGSTTLASIMNRYALKNKLSCLAYKSDSMRGHIRLDVLTKDSSRKLIPPLGVKTGDYARYKGYNMLTVHVRYQPKIIEHFMAKGTKYFTILREPSSHFESAFSFMGTATALFGRGHKSANVEKFVKNPLYYWNKLRPMTQTKVYARNGQIFDLTLDQRIHTDKIVVKSIITDLSKKMSLVLIMEHMDESLLLLKKLMCWSFRDISYVAKNHRIHSSTMTVGVRASLRAWNWADMRLYDHFNKTLWRKIEEYGPTFNNDLATFREVLAADYHTCVADEIAPDPRSETKKVMRTQLAKKSDYCTMLAGSSYKLFNRIFKRQMNTT